jgi:hypothetical protein
MKLVERGALVGAAALAALPLWVAAHPPIQDWPQHLAAIRVLHSFSDQTFGFEQFFVLDLGRTQYLTVYFSAHLLAYLVGVTMALKIVASVAIVSLPLMIAAFARELGRAPSVGLIAVPLTYSAHLILGFVNFVLALPLMFAALALAARDRRRPRRYLPWLTSAVLVACFYTHVVPFALGGLGAVLLGIGGSVRATLWRVLPLALGALVALPWLALSPAGSTLRGALGGSARGPVHLSLAESWEQIPLWLTDVWRSDWDRRLLLGWAAIAVLWVAAGAAAWVSKPERRFAARDLALAALPIACGFAYFLAPNSHAWIWPINTRFLLMGLLLMLPLVPSPAQLPQRVLALASAALGVLGVVFVARACIDFEREVGALDRAIAHIPPAQRVAGLIWSSGSEVVEFAPFLHAVAYYQAQRGGAVMFTFADFPQSPFRFREDNRPPRVRPRWEWMPERVVPDRDLAWYDWIITRGGPGSMKRSAEFGLVLEAKPWRVWQRRRAATASIQPPI